MNKGKLKGETMTFKVGAELSKKMAHIENRSDFIRNAILAALGNGCPLCKGSGTLNVAQREHWNEFSQHHRFYTCNDCREPHLVCDHEALSQ